MSIKNINKINSKPNTIGGVLLGIFVIAGLFWSLGHYQTKEAQADGIITEEAVAECINECTVTEYLELKNKQEKQSQELQRAKELKEKADQIITK